MLSPFISISGYSDNGLAENKIVSFHGQVLEITQTDKLAKRGAAFVLPGRIKFFNNKVSSTSHSVKMIQAHYSDPQTHENYRLLVNGEAELFRTLALNLVVHTLYNLQKLFPFQILLCLAV